MAKYKRIQKQIIRFLEENGPQNTRNIYEYINDNNANGIQINALTNVLSKNPEFVESHIVRVKGVTMNSYTLIVWKAKDDIS